MVQNASLTKSLSSISNTNSSGFINKQRNAAAAQSPAIAPRITTTTTSTTTNQNDKEVVSTTTTTTTTTSSTSTSVLSNSSESKTFRQLVSLTPSGNNNNNNVSKSSSLSYIPRSKPSTHKNANLEPPNVLTAAISLSSLTDENTESVTSHSSSTSSSSSASTSSSTNSLSSSSSSALVSEAPDYETSLFSTSQLEAQKARVNVKANKNKLSNTLNNSRQLTNRTTPSSTQDVTKELAAAATTVKTKPAAGKPEDTLSDIEREESFIIDNLINLSNLEMAIRKKSDQSTNHLASNPLSTTPAVSKAQQQNVKAETGNTVAKVNVSSEK